MSGVFQGFFRTRIRYLCSAFSLSSLFGGGGRSEGFLLLSLISPVIGRCSLRAEVTLVFLLTTALLPLGSKFRARSSTSFTWFIRVCYCLALPGSFPVPVSQLLIVCFSSLQPVWRVVLYFGTARDLYLCSFSFLNSPFLFFL